MAEAAISVIDLELKRYAGRPKIPFIPTATLNLLRGLDFQKELTNLDPKHRAALAGKFLQAGFQDVASTAIDTLKLSADEAAKRLQVAGATGEQIARALSDTKQSEAVTRRALAGIGVPSQNINTIVTEVKAAGGFVSIPPGLPPVLHPGLAPPVLPPPVLPPPPPPPPPPVLHLPSIHL
jgi:hypothetical protein